MFQSLNRYGIKSMFIMPQKARNVRSGSAQYNVTRLGR